LVALCLCSGGSSASAADAIFPAEIPNISFDYYPVSGRTVEEIARSLDRNRPVDPNDGQKVTALTHWMMGYSWPTDDRGRCDLSRASLQFQAVITFPRLVGETKLAPDVRQRWQRFSDALLRHEANHVRFAWDHRDEVLRSVRSSNCSRAAADGNRAIEAIARRDQENDRLSRHGELEGAVFP